AGRRCQWPALLPRRLRPGRAAGSPASQSAQLRGASWLLPPAGVNRHFHMICIRDKFSQNIGRQVPSKVIWDHLSTMYDMQALHESEILPFPNPERNFVLPEEIIHEVREGKVVIEEEMKEEMKEDVDPHNGADDGEWGAPADPAPGAAKPACRVRSGPEPPCRAFHLLGQEPRGRPGVAHGQHREQAPGRPGALAPGRWMAVVWFRGCGCGGPATGDELREAGPGAGGSSRGPGCLRATRQPQLSAACGGGGFPG
uniref:MRG domain binding protein n=1 Tax=Suricata suricatta TaxID=37032 RepID=A0A673VMH3_SURSU